MGRLNVCKNICERMETKSLTATWDRLGSGWKKCRTCSKTIKTNDLRCPCCGRKLSTRRRHNYKNRIPNVKCLYVREDN